MFKKLRCHIKEWKNEVLNLVLAVTLFLCTPTILRFIDPTAGAFDAGVLHIIVFSLTATVAFSFFAWIGMKLNFGSVFDYAQKGFLKDFETLRPWQKTKILLLVYFGYLLCLCAAANLL